MNRSGFTFIEVLVAMAIFVIAVTASIGLTGGSVKATRESKEISLATWLLQNVMVQLETRLETEGFDKGCEKRKEARFEPPYEKYTWVTYCNEIDFNLSQTAAQAANPDQSEDQQMKENLIVKSILQTASAYMTKSIRELHVEIHWVQGKTKRMVDATTHVARYDQPVVPQVAAQ